ncbi:MAG TPA: hypothetical protein VIU39_07510 [Anaerolineales bacterium]
MTVSNMNQRPNLITAIAVMTLLSGVVNIFWGLVASLTVLATIVGVVCTPITILPTILGVFEIIYAAKLLGNPPQPVRPSQTLAWFEVACILVGNAFSMIVGILALVFYNDLIVKAYFDALNRPEPPASLRTAPAEPVLPEPAPLPEEPAQPGEPPMPGGPRKVA